MAEAAFLEDQTAPFVTELEIARQRFRVCVDDRRTDRRVRRYFEPFLSSFSDDATRVVGIQGTPEYDEARLEILERPKGDPKISWYDAGDVRVIFKRRSGVVHYVWNGDFYAVGDIVKYPQQLLNLVATAYSYNLRNEGYMALHASSVSREGRGIALAGNSGSGKSTVSLALMEFGMDYVSNDRSFVRRRRGRVDLAGVPKWPRVNPGTLLHSDRLRSLLPADKAARYSHLSRSALWKLEDKHDVPVESVYGRGRLALNSTLDALYVLSWSQRGRGFDISPIDPSRVPELIEPLIKTEIYDPPGAAPTGRRLAKTIAGTPVFEVTGGADIPRLMHEIVDRRQLAAVSTG